MADETPEIETGGAGSGVVGLQRRVTRPVLPESGLTPGEQEVHDNLMAARRAWHQLDRQHPDEDREFTDAVHRIQDLLALRIVRREYPDFWPIHEAV